MYLASYIERTTSKRDYHTRVEGSVPRLFVTNTKPYQSVAPSTLAKWMIRALKGAHINTLTLKAH